ncbi:MAG: ATPase, partial [Gammaproteobacteria bacterium]
RYCSAERQIAIMQMINRFIKLSENAIDLDIPVESISTLPVMRKLKRMGEEIGEDDLDNFDDLRIELEEAFTQLIRHAKRETAHHEG